jgi:hypothetical protein
VGYGKIAQVRFISKTHGLLRPSAGDTLELTPNQSDKKVEEFDNAFPALQYSVYENGSGKYTYKQTNQASLAALLSDADPTKTGIFLDPAYLNVFHALVNHRGLDGKFFRSELALGCIPKGPGSSMSLSDPQARSIDFVFARKYELEGLAMLYTRALANAAAAVAAPPAPALAAAATGGNLGTGTFYVAISGVTAGGETDASPEAGIIIASGAVNLINVTIPALGSFTGYHVYTGTVSGELRRATTSAVTTSPFAITIMPDTTKAPAPIINTTGPFVQVLAADGTPGNAQLDRRWPASTPFTLTLDKPAVFVHNPIGNDFGYILAMKNGNPVTGGFVVKNDGTAIDVGPTAPAVADVWEFITAYTP